MVPMNADSNRYTWPPDRPPAADECSESHKDGTMAERNYPAILSREMIGLIRTEVEK